MQTPRNRRRVTHRVIVIRRGPNNTPRVVKVEVWSSRRVSSPSWDDLIKEAA